jgi:hypothetical protein
MALCRVVFGSDVQYFFIGTVAFSFPRCIHKVPAQPKVPVHQDICDQQSCQVFSSLQDFCPTLNSQPYESAPAAPREPEST